MEQLSFASLEFQNKKRETRREVFLEQLDSLMPWQRLGEPIRPHYPKAGRGRRPYDLSVMLRVHIVQLRHNLSNPAMEGLLYEAESVRRFAGLRVSEPIPDESTILHFRHLLERRQLGQGLFEEIKGHLVEQGVRLREGTIVDATIIEAPSSTKNRAGQRDPEMRQVKKGNQYHFGMKLHIGVDAETGLVHSLSATSANVHDVTEAPRLLHGGEQRVWGDAGYIGVQKREENLGLAVEDIDHSRTKANHPQTNGICERFHKTLQDESYSLLFRKKLYRDLEDLQTDLDAWLESYTGSGPIQAGTATGRPPGRPFRPSSSWRWKKT